MCRKAELDGGKHYVFKWSKLNNSQKLHISYNVTFMGTAKLILKWHHCTCEPYEHHTQIRRYELGCDAPVTRTTWYQIISIAFSVTMQIETKQSSFIEGRISTTQCSTPNLFIPVNHSMNWKTVYYPLWLHGVFHYNTNSCVLYSLFHLLFFNWQWIYGHLSWSALLHVLTCCLVGIKRGNACRLTIDDTGKTVFGV